MESSSSLQQVLNLLQSLYPSQPFDALLLQTAQLHRNLKDKAPSQNKRSNDPHSSDEEPTVSNPSHKPLQSPAPKSKKRKVLNL